MRLDITLFQPGNANGVNAGASLTTSLPGRMFFNAVRCRTSLAQGLLDPEIPKSSAKQQILASDIDPWALNAPNLRFLSYRSLVTRRQRRFDSVCYVSSVHTLSFNLCMWPAQNPQTFYKQTQKIQQPRTSPVSIFCKTCSRASRS